MAKQDELRQHDEAVAEMTVPTDGFASITATAVKLLKTLQAQLQAATPYDRAALYDRAAMGEKVFKDLKEAIKAWALNNQDERIDGYEVKQGNGVRAWELERSEVIASLMAAGLKESECTELISVTTAEKLLGNNMEAKTVVARMVKIVPGALTLKAKK